MAELPQRVTMFLRVPPPVRREFEEIRAALEAEHEERISQADTLKYLLECRRELIGRLSAEYGRTVTT